MPKQTQIEIFCPHCQALNHLDFTASDSAQDLTCSSCQGTIYWHVCPDCETGYYDAQKDSPCPDCTAGPVPVKDPLLYKPCPNCGGKIAFVSQILFSGRSVHTQCPHCRKTLEIKGMGKWLLITLLWWLVVVIMFDKIMPFEKIVLFLGKPLAVTMVILFVLAGTIRASLISLFLIISPNKK